MDTLIIALVTLSLSALMAIAGYFLREILLTIKRVDKAVQEIQITEVERGFEFKALKQRVEALEKYMVQTA